MNKILWYSTDTLRPPTETAGAGTDIPDPAEGERTGGWSARWWRTDHCFPPVPDTLPCLTTQQAAGRLASPASALHEPVSKHLPLITDLTPILRVRNLRSSNFATEAQFLPVNKNTILQVNASFVGGERESGGFHTSFQGRRVVSHYNMYCCY